MLIHVIKGEGNGIFELFYYVEIMSKHGVIYIFPGGGVKEKLWEIMCRRE